MAQLTPLVRLSRRSALAALAFAPCAWGDSGEVSPQRLRVPLLGEDAEYANLEGDLPLDLYLPGGTGPHPLALLHHERRYFTDAFPRYAAMTTYLLGRGWAVAVPLRAGYGERDEMGDRESLNCIRPRPDRVAVSTTVQAAAVLEGLSRHEAPIDRQRVLHVGVGVGGWAALCAAHYSPLGVVGAINFAGGLGAYPERFPGEPCGSETTARFARQLGRTAQRQTPGVSTLWLYAENDRHFGPRHAQAWFRAYRGGGGRGTFHRLPAWGDDGHHLMAEGRERWQPLVDDYLQSLPKPPGAGARS